MAKQHTTSTNDDERDLRDDARQGADAAAAAGQDGGRSPEQRLADGETGDGDQAAGLRAAIENTHSGTERRD